MEKNLLKIISLVTLISLSGCTGKNSSSTSSSSNVNSNSVTTNSSSSVVAPEGTIQYRVQVLLPNGEKAGEGLQVQWCNDTNCFSANTDANGVASTFLVPNTYDVHIYNYAETYACELGLKSGEDNTSIEVKLHDILSYKGGTGAKDNPYVVNEGVYNITLSDIDTEAKVASEVFVGFVPNRPGKYVIESWTENTDSINTNVGYYGNNPHYVPETAINGMTDDDSGDTDNFRLEFNIAIEEFVKTGEVDDNGEYIYEKDANGNYISGGIYRFGIGATNIRREKSFPIVIKYLEHYEAPVISVNEVKVTETLTKCSDADEDKVWKDCQINGLDTVVYNETDGKYHLGSEDGYVLYAKIAQPCAYIDKAFTEIQDSGNSALTLDNGTKDYTNFIDTYAEYCNSDGVYPVTNELKTFLELYFISSEAWITSISETIIDKECGWLFAVGYYANLADLYDKPWAGLGTSEEAYLINPGTFLADVSENSTVYYSFGPKNTVSESMYRVKSNDANIEFDISSDYKVTVITTEEGEKYFDITLGGTINPGICIFGVKTTDGSAAKVEFTLETREKTVAGDKITLGSNTVEVEDGGVVTCSLKVANAGTYKVTSSEENAFFFHGSDVYGGTYGEISFSVECAANDTIEFEILTIDGKADFITFNIEKGSSLKVGVNSISVGEWETAEEEFIAPEDGTYRFTPLDDNSLIGYSENGVTAFYPNDEGNYFEKELKAGDSLTVLLTTANYKKGNVRFTITKQ